MCPYFRDQIFRRQCRVRLVNLAGFAIMLLVPVYLSQVSGLSVPAVVVLAASPLGNYPGGRRFPGY